MSKIIFTACFLDGSDDSGSSRLQRNINYVNYYIKIKNAIGFDQFVMVDNGSSAMVREEFQKRTNSAVHMICREHLKRGPGPFEYPYCWRALYELKGIIEAGNVDKIIAIDSDGYVLSQRLANYIRNCNSGWETFWSHKYQFPTAELHILNQDTFPLFLEYTKTPWPQRMGGLMENAMPFTVINKNFLCDRFGETRETPRPFMDFYGQCPVDISTGFIALPTSQVDSSPPRTNLAPPGRLNAVPGRSLRAPLPQ